jgi:transposase
MGQRAKILTEILGYRGWKVRDAYFVNEREERVMPLAGYAVVPSSRLVLSVERKWAPRCSQCGAICRTGAHEVLEKRRWQDLEWAGHSVFLEATPIRVKCKRCQGAPVEMVAWAEPQQRQTTRLQTQLTIEAASMPIQHVASLHAMTWNAVRRAEGATLARWAATRPAVELHRVGVDEKWLGRRHKREYSYITIVSNLDTGEPVWIGPGRGEETLKKWIATLTPEQKSEIALFSMDMYQPFLAAIQGDPAFAHVVVVHDTFHLVKRANEAITEMRRETFFRAGPEMRRIGRGSNWLVLRAWERCSEAEQKQLELLFRYNPRLGRGYQVMDEYRNLLVHAPNREAMEVGLNRILRRTQERQNIPLRKFHDSLVNHRAQILNLAEHRPPTGRTEALNNNWETLVRRARGYRDLDYLLLKLRFMVVNPIRSKDQFTRFRALGLQGPLRQAA